MTNYEPTAFAKEVCARLRGLIARYDVNQSDLALICDVSQSQFSKIIRGVRPMTVDQAAALCDALDVDLATFMTEVDEFRHARNLRSSPLRYVDDGDRLDEPVKVYEQRVALDPWAAAARSRLPLHRPDNIDAPHVDDPVHDVANELRREILAYYPTLEEFEAAARKAGEDIDLSTLEEQLRAHAADELASAGDDPAVVITSLLSEANEHRVDVG